MTLPQAYDPEYGYRFQILYRYEPNAAWEHIDYAKDKQERDYLMGEYRLVGQGEYRSIELPRKYWP